jgi:hypothetical protein
MHTDRYADISLSSSISFHSPELIVAPRAHHGRHERPSRSTAEHTGEGEIRERGRRDIERRERGRKTRKESK